MKVEMVLYSKAIMIFLYAFFWLQTVFLSWFPLFEVRTKLFLLGIILYLGLRPVYIGADTYNYYRYFFYKSNWMEYGFTWLSKFINLFTNDPKFFLLSISFLTIFNISVSYKRVLKKDKLMTFSILIFLALPYGLQLSVNIVRQGLSLSFLLNALTINSQENKNKFLKICLLIVSFSIHKFTILFYLLYKLSNYHTIEKPLLLLFFSLLIGYFKIPLAIVNKFPYFGIRHKMIKFMRSNSIFSFVKILLYVFIYFFLKVTSDKKETYVRGFLNYYLYILVLASSIMFSDTAATRVLVFLDMMIPILVLHPKSSSSNWGTTRYLTHRELLIMVVFIIVFIGLLNTEAMMKTFRW